MGNSTDITALLAEWRQGSRGAFDRLFSLVHDKLREIARLQMRRMSAVDTISPTALVNEAFLKLVNQTQVDWRDRNHFLAVSATAMRHILINYAQSKQAEKRGGNWLRVTYDESGLAPEASAENLIALDDALEQLAEHEPRMARVVELRFFGGLTEAEIANVLDVNERTARRDWHKAKALLSLSLSGSGAFSGASAVVTETA